MIKVGKGTIWENKGEEGRMRTKMVMAGSCHTLCMKMSQQNTALKMSGIWY